MPHTVQPRDCVSSVFALDDGLLVRSVPVLKLGVELEGDELQLARVVVPGEVAVDTDHVHKRSLKIRQKMGCDLQRCTALFHQEQGW